MRLRAISYGRVKRNGGEDPHLLPSFSLHILLFSPSLFFFFCRRAIVSLSTGDAFEKTTTKYAAVSRCSASRSPRFVRRPISRNFEILRRSRFADEIRATKHARTSHHPFAIIADSKNYRRIALARLRYRNDLISGIIKF